MTKSCAFCCRPFKTGAHEERFCSFGCAEAYREACLELEEAPVSPEDLEAAALIEDHGEADDADQT